MRLKAAMEKLNEELLRDNAKRRPKLTWNAMDALGTT